MKKIFLRRVVLSLAIPALYLSSQAQSLYWDSNGSTAGAGATPIGNWITSGFWSTDLDGLGTPGAWTDGSIAIFSAGTDAVNAFTNTITTGTSVVVGGITVEEGTPTIAGPGASTVLVLTNAATIDIAASRTGIVNSIIGGTAGLVKNGAGQLTINSNNTYTGNTTLNAGTVILGFPATFGDPAGTLYWSGARLISVSNRQTGSIYAPIKNPIMMTADTLIAGPGTISLLFDNTIASTGGTLTVSNTLTSGTFSLQLNGGGYEFTNSIVLVRNGAGQSRLDLWASNTSPVQIFSGVISGAGFVRRSAFLGGEGGTTVLAAQNTYTNTTQCNGGFLGFGVDSIGVHPAVVSGPIGTNTLTIGNDPNVGLLAWGGNRTIGNRLIFGTAVNTVIGGTNNLAFVGPIDLGTTTRSITVTNPNITFTFGGVVNNTAALTKAGQGTIIFTNANIQTGNLTVSAGKAFINNLSGSGLGTGNAIINNGGTFGGSGSMTGAVTVNNNGTISPGTSPGKIITGNETWAGGGIYKWEINDVDAGEGLNPGWDQISINGGLNITATSGNKFNINITSLDLSGLPAPVGDFNNATSYSWTILKTTVGITNFNPNAINLNTNNFQNSLGTGRFSINTNLTGTDLVLTFSFPPFITSQSSGQTVASGGSATFSVSATGTGPITYQWRKNGVDIGGATDSSYTINPVAGTDAGSYRVFLSNPDGTTLSATATLAVSPTITSQPSDATRVPGDSVTFTVVADGQAPLSYQWKKNGSNIGGATQSSYTINPVQGTDAASYTVSVTNSAGSVTSTAAILTVAPDITTQPQSQTIAVTSNAVFTVEVTGSTPFTYQWKKGGSPLSDGGNISGATSATLTLSSITLSDADNYSVEITNPGGTTNSATAVLTVTAVPVITTEPVSQTIGAGTNAIFSVEVSGAEPLSYQWNKNSSPLSNGGNISGATTPTLTITAVTQADAADYTLVVTNSSGSDTSVVATLTVIDPPAITLQPEDQTVTEGADVTFTVVATGTSPSYQWKKNSIDIAGATTSSLSLNDVTLADAGDYTVVLSNLAAVVTSDTATLVVNAAPIIITQPQNQTVNLGAAATFSVGVTGHPLNFQWRFNGENIAGATTSSYTIGSVQNTNIGYYSVVITNFLGSVTSSDATLAILTKFFADNFDINSSTNWIINKSSTDTLVVFSYDYSADGIPSAPGSSGGSTRGVKFDANIIAPGATEAINISPTNQSFAGDYQLHFKMWINANGPFPDGGVGSTEYITAGVAASGNRVAWTGAGALTNGHWFAVDGEGNSGVDFRALSATTLHAPASGIYSAGTDPDARSADFEYYHTTFPGGQTPPPYQTNTYPQQTGELKPGTVGFAWRDVVITKQGNRVEWFIDGLSIAHITNTVTGSNVFVGYWDVFSSIADNPAVSFGLVDNVQVETINAGIAPTITSQPTSASVAAGTTVLFTVAATSPTALRYQWQKNGVNIAGATAATLTLPNVLAADAGDYRALVLNDCSFVTSDTATLTVGDPAILVQPVGQSANGGDTVTISVTAAGTSLTYQWKKNGIDIAGATGSSLTFSPIYAAHAGDYSVGVTNGFGSGLLSSTATLTVIDPVITVQPVSQAVGFGTNVTFTVSAGGTPTLFYVWKKNGAPLLNGPTVTGATTPTLTLLVPAVGSNSFSVTVSNSLGTVNSSNATLLVQAKLLGVTTMPPAPATVSKTNGNFNIFTAKTTGGLGAQFQWLFNGAPISGATGSAFIQNPLTLADTGSYSVIAANAANSVTSGVITLNVFADAINPLPTAGKPKPLGIYTNVTDGTLDVFPINGTVKDNGRVTNVMVSINGGSLQPMTLNPPQGSNNVSWSGSVAVLPGTNTFSVSVTDYSGNTTNTPPFKFFFHVGSPFTLLTNSDPVSVSNVAYFVSAGVAGHNPTNGGILQVGRTYKITAKPWQAPYYILTNWTATWDGQPTPVVLQTNNAIINFTMRSNMVLNANYITNPLVKLAGLYHGLFYETNGVSHHSSGFAQLNITPKFSGSGKFFMDGDPVPVPIKVINIDGTFKVFAPRGQFGKPGIWVEGSLDFAGGSDTLSAKVTEVEWGTTNWTSDLVADRYVWSLANPADAYTNAYTMTLQSFTNNADGPVGYSAFTMSLISLGTVTTIGNAADNSVKGLILPIKAPVSKNGVLPFYGTLYPKLDKFKTNNDLTVAQLTQPQGSMLGWLTFAANTNAFAENTNLAPQGQLSWIKKAGWTNQAYTAGFTSVVDVVSSRHLNLPLPQSLYNFTNAYVVVVGDGLLGPFTNIANLTNNTFKVPKVGLTNALTVPLAMKTGGLKGAFTNAVFAPTVKITWLGVMLQDYNYGRGFFMTTNGVNGYSGQVFIDPKD